MMSQREDIKNSKKKKRELNNWTSILSLSPKKYYKMIFLQENTIK